MSFNPEIPAPQLLLSTMETIAPDGEFDPAFLALYGAVKAARHEDPKIDTAIISDGNEGSVRTKFTGADLRIPGIIIGNLDLAAESPTPQVMTDILREWRQMRSGVLLPSIVYVSRHRHGEGWLAEESGARFVHISDNNSAEDWATVGVLLNAGSTISEEHVRET